MEPNPYEAPKLRSESRASEWHWKRGVAVVIAFMSACYAHMAISMTPNTSFEHHPFSGPLSPIHSYVTAEGKIFGWIALAVLGAGICLPGFRFHFATVAIATVSVGAWILLSYWCAVVASV
jgi:hypothetical protein